jgi:hypothetical protein
MSCPHWRKSRASRSRIRLQPAEVFCFELFIWSFSGATDRSAAPPTCLTFKPESEDVAALKALSAAQTCDQE